MLGIDVVSISRLEGMLARSDRLEERLCSRTERAYCHSKATPVRHLAGTVAAKEAVIKAARLGRLVAWTRRIEISRDSAGVPSVSIDGRLVPVAVSISHDGDVAIAAALILPPGMSLLDVNRVTAEFVTQR